MGNREGNVSFLVVLGIYFCRCPIRKDKGMVCADRLYVGNRPYTFLGRTFQLSDGCCGSDPDGRNCRIFYISYPLYTGKNLTSEVESG